MQFSVVCSSANSAFLAFKSFTQTQYFSSKQAKLQLYQLDSVLSLSMMNRKSDKPVLLLFNSTSRLAFARFVYVFTGVLNVFNSENLLKEVLSLLWKDYMIQTSPLRKQKLCNGFTMLMWELCYFSPKPMCFSSRALNTSQESVLTLLSLLELIFSSQYFLACSKVIFEF